MKSLHPRSSPAPRGFFAGPSDFCWWRARRNLQSGRWSVENGRLFVLRAHAFENMVDSFVIVCDGRRRMGREKRLIAQTLHGYDQGHRLVAVGGHVNEDELGWLDRLSDLSGYVPVGTEFDQYHTGFPCGRYYAFACTWPDRTATRAGTVLTHTLLIPRPHLGAIQDLWNVQGHRRPASAFDREPYREELAFDLTGATNDPPTPALDRATAAISLWFGQPERPVLWLDDTHAEDAVRYLWSLLWQQARESFSFCTFSLQTRYLHRTPFGFLVLPSAARGAFHDFARSPAWWTDDGLANSTLRERAKQSWIHVIFEQGPKATHLMSQFCTEHGLIQLDALAFPIFFRFEELDEPSTSRLAAARSRADLLERLWPGIDPEHPLVRTTLERLAKLQREAALAPRPFWDLIDFVKRPAVRPLVASHAELATEWGAVIGQEVERRIVEAERIEEIGSLLHDVPDEALREKILAAITRVCEYHSNATWFVSKGSALLLSSIDAQCSDIVSAVFRPLRSEQRSSLALRALEDVPEQSRVVLTDYLVSAARRWMDMNVVVDIYLALEQPKRALEEATSTALSAPTIRLDSLDRVLRRLGPDERFTWALSVHDSQLASWAGNKAREAAKELRLGLSAILDRCRGTPNEGAVLLACLEDQTLSELNEEDWTSLAIARALATYTEQSPATKKLAEFIAPQIIRRVADGSWDSERALLWFALPAVEMALASMPVGMLYGAFGKAQPWDKDCLPNVAKALATWVRSSDVTSLDWMTNVLTKPLQDAFRSSFARAEDDLLVLVNLPEATAGWPLLASHLLVAVKKNSTASAYRLVERIFPVIYGRIVRNELDPASHSLLRPLAWRDWDTAKSWRHWVLDIWLHERWPAASFLRALGEDRTLFRRIAHRAWHKRKAKDFVTSLPHAFTNDAELAKRWRKPIADFVADPDSKTDYE